MKKSRYLFIILLLALDQLSKLAIKNYLDVGENIPIIKNFFLLTHVENSGAAFSILTGKYTLLIALPIVAIIFAIWYMEKHLNSHWTLRVSLILIIAGGIGNLIDRIQFKYVVDMFNFTFFPAVFNVADICICVGCGLLVLYMFVFDNKKASLEEGAKDKSGEENEQKL